MTPCPNGTTPSNRCNEKTEVISALALTVIVLLLLLLLMVMVGAWAEVTLPYERELVAGSFSGITLALGYLFGSRGRP